MKPKQKIAVRKACQSLGKFSTVTVCLILDVISMSPIQSFGGIHGVVSRSFKSENKAGIKIKKYGEKNEDGAESEQSKGRITTAVSEIGTSKETKEENTVRDKGEDEELSDDRRFSDSLQYSISQTVGKCRKSTRFLL